MILEIIGLGLALLPLSYLSYWLFQFYFEHLILGPIFYVVEWLLTKMGLQ